MSAALRGSEKIGLRVGRVINKRKMAKHFVLEITEDSFAHRRNEVSIATEAILDGFYVVRTNVPAEALRAEDAVLAYKRLDGVERAFRAFNSDLDLRPIRHWKEQRARAHLLLRMLAYYVQWHMAERVAPILFKDHDLATAAAARHSPVAPATRSPGALTKVRRKRTDGGQPVHSFTSLLVDLATVAVNTVQPSRPGAPPFRMMTTPTETQRHAFDLLGVDPRLGVA